MMGLTSINANDIVVGTQICWMPQRPMYDHGISKSILEFGFITGAMTAAGVPVRLWTHDQYHNYGTTYQPELADRYITPTDLFYWTAVAQARVTDALKLIQGE